MCQTIALEYTSSVIANCSVVDTVVMDGILQAHDCFMPSQGNYQLPSRKKWQ